MSTPAKACDCPQCNIAHIRDAEERRWTILRTIKRAEVRDMPLYLARIIEDEVRGGAIKECGR